MPTGYTAPLYEGKDITFEQFLMRCARAFGAFVHQRDEPLDAQPRDDESKRESYYERELPKDRQRLKWLRDLSDEEADKCARESFEDQLQRWDEMQESNSAMRLRYQRMLAKAEQWQPPSEEHVRLKEFMIEQISDSIKYDCPVEREFGVPARLNGPEWREVEIECCERSIKLAEEHIERDKHNLEERKRWAQQLRESVTVNS